MQSASYSSTAGPLLTPVSSTYGHAGPSESNTEQQPTASPRSASDSTTLSAYNAGLTATAISPNVTHINQSSAHHPSATQNLQVGVPTHAPVYINTPPQYQYQSQQQQHMTQVVPHTSLMTQPERASWDYTPFLETSPATGTSRNVQALEYERNVGGMSITPDQGSSAAFRHHYQQTSRG